MDSPVPPLAMFNVPPNVTAPVVGVAGVKPVVLPLKDNTGLAEPVPTAVSHADPFHQIGKPISVSK